MLFNWRKENAVPEVEPYILTATIEIWSSRHKHGDGEREEKKMNMDQYILEALEGEFLLHESLPVLNQRAFVPYTSRPITEKGLDKPPNSMNMNKRMVQFLRKSWAPATARIVTGDDCKERGFRHMLNERMRREKQKQSYMALHSMLPTGAKVGV